MDCKCLHISGLLSCHVSVEQELGLENESFANIRLYTSIYANVRQNYQIVCVLFSFPTEVHICDKERVKMVINNADR